MSEAFINHAKKLIHQWKRHKKIYMTIIIGNTNIVTFSNAINRRFYIWIISFTLIEGLIWPEVWPLPLRYHPLAHPRINIFNKMNRLWELYVEKSIRNGKYSIPHFFMVALFFDILSLLLLPLSWILWQQLPDCFGQDSVCASIRLKGPPSVEVQVTRRARVHSQELRTLDSIDGLGPFRLYFLELNFWFSETVILLKI